MALNGCRHAGLFRPRRFPCSPSGFGRVPSRAEPRMCRQAASGGRLRRALANFPSTPAKRNPAPVRKREPGHLKGSFQKLSVPRDDRPLAEGSLTNRSLANGSNHRRRLSARQIGCDGSAHHRDSGKSSKEKLQHHTLPVLNTAATITARVFGEYLLSLRGTS